MRRTLIEKSAFVLMIAILIGFAAFQFADVPMAGACGYNNSGGEGYAPQRRDDNGFLAQKNNLTEPDARKIVVKHVARLNPELTVGKIVDSGAYFEAEILNQDQEVIQIMGVDKQSGQLRLIN